MNESDLMHLPVYSPLRLRQTVSRRGHTWSRWFNPSSGPESARDLRGLLVDRLTAEWLAAHQVVPGIEVHRLPEATWMVQPGRPGENAAAGLRFSASTVDQRLNDITRSFRRYESGGGLRFVSRVGSGFDQARLRHIHSILERRARPRSPFRRAAAGEPKLPADSHFCEPEFVCEVRFTEWTDEGGLRHPVFLRMIEAADPRECAYLGPGQDTAADAPAAKAAPPGPVAPAAPAPMAPAKPEPPERKFTITNPDKIFWPAERYTKGDLVAYYQAIAPWMLPYLKDRPVVLTRYPDGIEGKSFFQKDAPGFAPEWIRKETIYSEDSQRDIAYFILESAEAIGYMANMGTIPIHLWSSHLPHLERPDWLLFDIDPKGSTTARAVVVAREVGAVLRQAGLRPYLKTSGQNGLHVVVGLEPRYTYEQARMFSELVARLVSSRIPDDATLIRDTTARAGRVYIDYLQLGYGKTIAAPFAVRPVPGAPVSAPLKWQELREDLDPVAFNIKTMPKRMARVRSDPFIGALEDPQLIEPALERLERELRAPRG
jgi:bifunctional non-homologous end joining protein LigD